MELTFEGKPIHTNGDLPKVGSVAPAFNLTNTDLKQVTLNDYSGKNLILNIFISVDTPVCSLSVTKFNKEAASLNNTVVLCISMDLPFALKRFCGAKNIENVTAVSAFKSPDFGKNYGVTLMDGPLDHLLSRAVIIINPQGKILYTEQVPEITHEPNYEAALKVLK